jgi:hypothetical protein
MARRPSKKTMLRLRRAHCPLLLLFLMGGLGSRKPITYGRPRRPAAASFLICQEGLALYDFLNVYCAFLMVRLA